MNDDKRTFIRDGGEVWNARGHPYFLVYVKPVWTITCNGSFKKRNGKAFLKLKTEGLK